MAALDCYLSRRSNGLYILTEKPPREALVGTFDVIDLYPILGDALAWQTGACAFVIEKILGEKLRRLDILPVTLSITKGHGPRQTIGEKYG